MVETRTIRLPVVLPGGFQDCERCAGRLQDSLLQINGVTSVRLNRDQSTMTLTYDPHLVPLEDVEKRAGLIGVELKEHFHHRTLRLEGLDCPDCALKLEKGVGNLDGVIWVSTNYASSRMSVEYLPERTSIETIVQRVHDLGYDIDSSGDTGAYRAMPRRWFASRQTLLTAASGLAIAAGLIAGGLGSHAFSSVFFVLAAALAGSHAARGALFSLRSLVLDMNFLMTAAAIGAIAIGEHLEAAAVMFLFSLGNALEAATVERARNSVRSLVTLFPTRARVSRDGREEDVPVAELRLGDTFIVRPGDKIATDGKVISGNSSVNQASVTGESTPVDKQPGDSVYAGSINHNGALSVTVSVESQDNTLARIVRLVEQAQAEKAPSQRFAEKFGRYYTPAVTVFAVLVAILPPLVAGIAFNRSLYMALTLLVVSCPCALVISTPVSIVSAIGNAAWTGVLIKGGSYLEAMGRVQVIAFDKTGTITTGVSEVTDILPAEGLATDDVLRVAASAESCSEHPLAAAVLRRAGQEGIETELPSDFQALTGMGVAATVDGNSVLVGNGRLMDQLGIDTGTYAEDADRLQAEGKTVIMVALNGRLAGLMALADSVRDSARQAFAELRRSGVKRIVMLTGDNDRTAGAVARDLQIDEYYSELLPQDKVDVIRLLTERFGNRIAFVGDGVNDAPALAAATVGVALGAFASDTAMETADVALMSGDLAKLGYLFRLSRRTIRTIKQNICFSLVVILVLIAGTLLERLRLSFGVMGHEGSALLVIVNGMRLLRFR